LAYAYHNNLDGCIAAYKGFHPHMLGSDNYAFIKETHEGTEGNMMLMQQIQEKKPFTSNKMNEWASNGTYYFKNGNLLLEYFGATLQDENMRVNNEFYVSMVYNKIVQAGMKVGIYPIQHMLQWGTPYDLQVYNGWSSYFRDIIKPKQFVKNPEGTTTILPMAGKGSRFSVKGYSIPKPLLDVNGYPMFHQAVDCLPYSTNYGFITLQEHCETYPELTNTIQTHYKNANILKLDKVTEGQACTCYEMIQHLDPEQPVLITACDNASYWNAEKYQQLLDDTSNDIIVWSFTHSATGKLHPEMYSWLDVDENGDIHKAFVKQCPFDNPFDRFSIIGTFFFRKAKYFTDAYHQLITKSIRSNGEFYVDNLLNEAIQLGYKSKNFTIDHYICWGIPEEYETYNYWKSYFHKTVWHPYKIFDDCTFNSTRFDIIQASNEMKSIKLNHSIVYAPHQGWTDLLESIPKLNFLAEMYEHVYITVRHTSVEMFQYYLQTTKQTNITIQSIQNDGEIAGVVQKLQNDHRTFFIADNTWRPLGRNLTYCYPWMKVPEIECRANFLSKAWFSHDFYFGSFIDLSIRGNYFKFPGGLCSSNNIKSFIVTHDDVQRNMSIRHSKLPIDKEVKKLQGSYIFDNIPLLFEASEIHCIMSLYALLTYYCKTSLGLKTPLYVHEYSRNDRSLQDGFDSFFMFPSASNIHYILDA
jgi:hypothetical protein